jgi:hypothetical protein
MVELVPGRTVRTLKSELPVDNRFEPGTYRFRLVVIDDEANSSLPSELLVVIGGSVTRTTGFTVIATPTVPPTLSLATGTAAPTVAPAPTRVTAPTVPPSVAPTVTAPASAASRTATPTIATVRVQPTVPPAVLIRTPIRPIR